MPQSQDTVSDADGHDIFTFRGGSDLRGVSNRCQLCCKKNSSVSAIASIRVAQHVCHRAHSRTVVSVRCAHSEPSQGDNKRRKPDGRLAAGEAYRVISTKVAAWVPSFLKRTNGTPPPDNACTSGACILFGLEPAQVSARHRTELLNPRLSTRSIMFPLDCPPSKYDMLQNLKALSPNEIPSP